MAGGRKRKRPMPGWAQGLAYGGIRAGGALIPMGGVQPSMRFMRTLGGGFGSAWFNAERVSRAVSNIRWCFPEWDEERARDYAIESYRHLFSLASEVLVMPRLITEEGYARYVTMGEMREGLRTMLEPGPSILITGHCGNWELLGYTLAMLGFPSHALYRPLDMKPLDRWLKETRARRGLRLVDKFGAAEVLPGLIERDEMVGFIADQNAGDRGLFVPFFNRLASAYKTIGLLALRYRVPIVCGQARRLSGVSAEGARRSSQVFRYEIDVVDVIRPGEWDEQPDPLFYVTARYRRAIELMVRRAPEQYLWMHRYWKSRPPHERRGRAFPARLREKIASLPWMTEGDVERVVERSARDAREAA